MTRGRAVLGITPFVVSCLLALTPAFSQGDTGDPITNNDYRIDLTRTVTTGSTRKIAMGGAFVGLAEGNAAIPDNPAAVAYRPRAFDRDWEFDMVLGTLITTNDDADNSGSASLTDGQQALIDAGLMAQYKNFGIGGVAQITSYSSASLPEDQEARLVGGNVAMGYTAFARQLAFGISMNPVGARLYQPGDFHQQTFSLKGLGWGGGMIWHPDRAQWHFGAAYTSAVSSDQDLAASTGPVKVGNLIVPNGVLETNTWSVGTAYEWNDFPLWRDRPAIGTFDLHFFGESPADANGSTAFATQTYTPEGQKTIMTIHGGLEVEAVPRFLRLRVGTYHEPSRYDGISAREHITGGFEMRLTKFNVWDHRPLAISYAIDAASRYQVHSISIWLYTFTVPVPSPQGH